MGRFLAGFTVIAALMMGFGLYYTQVYAYYDEVSADAPIARMALTTLSGTVEEIPAEDFEAIDSESSPIRFRACFTTTLSQAMLTETYELAENAVPLNGPGWFECYDARAIGEALEAGDALAFLAERNIRDGVDRIIAIFPDGRGYAWHQLNEKYRK